MLFRTTWILMLTIKRRRKKTNSAALPLVLSMILWLPTVIAQQSCFGGVETFEKTVSMIFTASTQVQGLVSQPGSAVTRDCAALCKQSSSCAAFAVDYTASRCQSVDADAVSKRDHVKESSAANYFEKICLRRVTNLSTCGDRLWVFERVIGAFLQGFDDSEHSNVATRADCHRLCLEQTTFICRSAEYDQTNQICRLSREDRRTQPSAFRHDGGSFDYLENQCVRTLPDCRYMTRNVQDSSSISMDQVEFAQSQGECESLCDQTRVFTCRAYSFTADENRCYLSGDDSVSRSLVSGGPSDLVNDEPDGKEGTVYAEKICSISQCENGIFTFEKVTGHFLRSARQEVLNQGKNEAGKSSHITDGITVECGKICLEIGSDCPAYSVDYTQGRCFKLDRNSQGRAQEFTMREGVSYFEKICLRGNVGTCRDQAWAFERHPGKELRGFDDRVIPLVASRRDCQEACLQETRFVCRSAEYNMKTLDCRLSSMDRRLRPDIYIDASINIEYLENQCVSQASSNCAYQTVENMYPRYMDLSLSNVSDEKQCQQLCHANRAFTCRSYSFYPAGSQCFISSEDRGSAGLAALHNRQGTNYTERKCTEFALNVSPLLPAVPNAVTVSSAPLDHQGVVTPAFMTGPNFGLLAAPAPGAEAAIHGRNVPDKCRPGRTHFQRVTGYEVVGSRTASLRQMPMSVPPGPNRNAGIMVDCLNLCRTDPRCLGFNYHTVKQTCHMLESDPSVQGSVRTNNASQVLIRPSAGVVFFEALCLHAPACVNMWTTERWPGYHLRGHHQEVLRGLTRATCAERCIEHRRFACRSASYDTQREECRLSGEDRHSQPQSFQANPIYDYIENQCTPESRQCRYGSVQSDRALLYADRMISVAEPGACQAACDSERHFRCRSYSTLMSPQSSSPSQLTLFQCWLSSSTSSAGGGSSASAQPIHQMHRGAKYVERDCTLPPGPSGNEIQQPDPQPVGSVTTIRNSVLGNSPGGGWVSLASAAVSRSRQTGANGAHVPTGPAPVQSGSAGGSANGSNDNGGSEGDNYPIFSANYNPLLPRTPIQTNRRPPDGLPFDFNNAGVSNRPLTPNNNRWEANPSHNHSYSSKILPGGATVQNGAISGVNGRCRGTASYDKVAYADYIGARRQEHKLTNNANPTAECLRECDRQGERCLAVVLETDRHIHYDFLTNVTPLLRQVCYILDRSASADNVPLQHSLYTMYFEKTCLPEQTCGKPWAFIRVHGYELEGLDEQSVQNVANKEECQAACLRMGSNICRSAEYVPRQRLCRLSKENRRTQLKNFKVSATDTIYMENQCTADPAHCDYTDREGRSSPWFDRAVLLTSVTTPVDALTECRRLCDAEREFLCKSVSLQVKRSKCFLSSDDSISLNGANAANALMPDRDFIYSERASCSNIRVECAQSDMVVTMAFGLPFTGRVYATGNPQACFEMGNGRSTVTLRIPLGGQCGTVQQARGRYINHIVMQQNPVIMTENDSTIRVECTFETPDQTVSFTAGGRREGSDMFGPGGLDVTAPFRPMGHNIVTNTAPSPSVRMKITARSGDETHIVGLGEPLTLRIEVDPTSPFAISARNVEARTENGEIMTLIDATGCPRDRSIFPVLDVDLATRSLFADFKAFRFPSTATVNFVATVVFCQTRCEPTRCSEGWESHGRRRRQAEFAANETTPVASGLIDTTEDYGESETVPMTPDPSVVVPVEVPLHLKLIVAPETGPVARPAKLTEPTPQREPEWRPPSLVAYSTRDEDLSQSQLVCTARATVITVTVVAVLLQMILIAAFIVFYRFKRSAWLKWSTGVSAEPPTPPTGGLYPSGSVSDVSFRSVYRDVHKKPGTLRGLNLNFDHPSRCHVASVFSDPQ